MDDHRKVYILPNLMTAGNLICGFMAVLQIFEGTMLRRYVGEEWHVHYEYSLYFILLACVFDLLDGRMARMSGHMTPFGREFDSLADIVSFGVAPALLLFNIVLYELPDRLGWVIGGLYLVCGAMRLARFNVTAAELERKGVHKNDFEGLPIPAAAGLIASITLTLLTLYQNEQSIGYWKYVLAGLMVVMSLMMFSEVRYPSFKGLNLKTKRTIPRFLVIVLTLGVIGYFWRYSLTVIFTSYLIYGFVRPRITKRWRPDFDDEEENGESHVA
ncbi:MAG: CDP-diacylglycerol--serine O-phosphatidyltransferase [Verrucomicrobiota bacterium]